MQKVINSQQSLIHKICYSIKDKFDQREVGHSSFKIQEEVKVMIARFKTKVINEINIIKVRQDTGINTKQLVTSDITTEWHSGK